MRGDCDDAVAICRHRKGQVIPSLPVAATTTEPALIAASTALCMVASHRLRSLPKLRLITRAGVVIRRHTGHRKTRRPPNCFCDVRQLPTALAQRAHRKNANIPTNAGNSHRITGIRWRQLRSCGCHASCCSADRVGRHRKQPDKVSLLCSRDKVARIRRVRITPIAVVRDKIRWQRYRRRRLSEMKS